MSLYASSVYNLSGILISYPAGSRDAGQKQTYPFIYRAVGPQPNGGSNVLACLPC